MRASRNSANSTAVLILIATHFAISEELHSSVKFLVQELLKINSLSDKLELIYWPEYEISRLMLPGCITFF